MTSHPITCIVPVFNSEQTLTEAVQSIIATGYSSLEILLVDDGSKDSSREIANELKSKHPEIIRTLEHPGGENRGAAASRNLGLVNSTGDYICFLDADDIYLPNRFEKSVSILAENPNISGVYEYAKLEFSTAELREQWRSDPEKFGLFCEPNQTVLAALLTGKTWPISGILFRKELLKRTGLFNESFRTSEDCHLWYRMAAISCLVPGFVDQPVCVYQRVTGSLFSHGWQARETMVRAQIDFYRWLQSVKTGTDKPAVEAEILNYVIQSISEARSQNQPQIARRLCRSALRSLPASRRSGKFWKNCIHAYRSMFFRDPIASHLI